MSDLVLASTSPYRKQLLERLPLPFKCVDPGVDEGPVKAEVREPEGLVRTLARRKALAVSQRHPKAQVIGCDQVATIDGRVLDKPGSAARAVAQLTELQGREHALLTAAAIANGGQVIEFLDVTRLCMRALDAAEIERYVAAEEPFDCAGSYKIEGLGLSLFVGIDSEDQTAIVGLPLMRLSAELRQLGFSIP